MEATMPPDVPDGPVPAPEIFTLTPQQATERLQQMHDALHPPPGPAPVDAQGARQLLDQLVKDPTWGAALVRGDPQARKQFADLTKLVADGDDVGDAIAGIVEPETSSLAQTTAAGQLPRREIAQAVADFRAAGLDDGSIAMAMNGGTVSVAEYRAAEALLSARKSDPVWRDRLLAGDYAAKRDFTLLTVILSCDIAEPK